MRTVVHEKRFETEARAIQADTRRMDEALQYVEFRLARQPDAGIQTSVPGIWVAPVRVPGDDEMVRASIFYTFTEDHVYLQSMQLAP